MRMIDADALLKGHGDHEMISTHLIWNAPTIKTKQIKYYDEDENVWKIGSVIVDGEREGE